jgi:hypothetical protein
MVRPDPADRRADHPLLGQVRRLLGGARVRHGRPRRIQPGRGGILAPGCSRPRRGRPPQARASELFEHEGFRLPHVHLRQAGHLREVGTLPCVCLRAFFNGRRQSQYGTGTLGDPWVVDKRQGHKGHSRSLDAISHRSPSALCACSDRAHECTIHIALEGSAAKTRFGGHR